MKDTYLQPGIDREYYPTPIELGRQMCSFMTLSETKFNRVLEPQAGTGSLVNAIFERAEHQGARIQIDAIEIDDVLRASLSTNLNAHVLQHTDFLTFDQNIKYDYIIMNPPYSVVEKHVEKAIQHLESNGGGTLITQASENFLKPWPLCKRAHALMNRYGYEVIHMGQPYQTGAERTTDIGVVFIIVHVKSKG